MREQSWLLSQSLLGLAVDCHPCLADTLKYQYDFLEVPNMKDG